MSISTDSSIKIISFDIWLTIVNKNKNFNLKRKEMILKRITNIYPQLKGSDLDASFENMKHETERNSEITGKHIGFKERINDLLSRLDVPTLPAEQLLEIEKEQDILARKYAPPLLSNNIPSLFQNIINSGRKIAIISNTGMLTSDHVRLYLNIHGLARFISFEVYSDENGFTKPNKKAFDNLLHLTKLEPESILHIGDSETADFNGAKSCRFQAILACLNDDGVAYITKLLRL